MKGVLNIIAAVLIGAGLVVFVASLLTPGQVLLGIDFKLSAILLVGGLILHALASALLLLHRMSGDIRQLRKAGSAEPPWLRQAAAAMAPVAYAVPAATEAVPEDMNADVAEDIAEEPPATAEAAWAEAAEAQVRTAGTDEDEPDVPEPYVPEPYTLEADAYSPLIDVPPPEPEPVSEPQANDDLEPAEVFVADEEAEAAAESEAPEAPAVEALVEPVTEPEPAEPDGELPGPPEPVEAADEVQSEAGEPEPAEAEDRPEVDRAERPSELKPSEDAVAAASQSPALESLSEPTDASRPQEPAAAEPAALYVVEERQFRGKQARVLSDGTIEAETAEGWMRFEDFDHLEEYLDAMAELGR